MHQPPMTGLIVGPDGATGTAPTDADNGSLENLGIVRPPAQLALAGTNGVSYEVRIFDDDDPAGGTILTAADIARIGEDGNPLSDANSTLVIQAIGYAPDNTMVTFEATIGNTAAVLPAVVVGGDAGHLRQSHDHRHDGRRACQRRPGPLGQSGHRSGCDGR